MMELHITYWIIVLPSGNQTDLPRLGAKRIPTLITFFPDIEEPDLQHSELIFSTRWRVITLALTVPYSLDR